MKNTIIKFGLLIGIFYVLNLIISMELFYSTNNLNNGSSIGIVAFVLISLLFIVGINTYKNKNLNGTITFVQALLAGLGMFIIAATIYVLAWLVYYYTIHPNFMDKYSLVEINKINASTKSIAEKTKALNDVNTMATNYKNPIMVILYTYMETTLSIPMVLIGALVAWLRRKKTI
jgi:hypothetical protein